MCDLKSMGFDAKKGRGVYETFLRAICTVCMYVHTGHLVEHKSSNLNALTWYSGPRFTQIKGAMRDRKVLAPFRIIGVEDGDFRVQLIGYIVPFVIGVVIDLEYLVGNGGEYFVDNKKVLFPIDAFGVAIGHWIVSTWTREWLPYAVRFEN